MVLYLLYLTLLEGVLKQFAKGDSTLTLLVYPLRDIMLWILFARAYLIEKPLTQNSPQKGFHKVNILILFFVLWILAKLLFLVPNSSNPMGILIAIRPYLEWIPLFYLGYRYLNDQKTIIKMSFILLITTSINAVVAVVQYFLGPYWLASLSQGYSIFVFDNGRSVAGSAGQALLRPPGLGNDMGFSGVLALISVPFLLYLYLNYSHKHQPGAKLVLFVFSVLIILGVISSTSRSMLLIFIAEIFLLAIYLIFLNIKGRWNIALIIGIISLTFYFVAATSPILLDRYQSISSPSTLWTTFSQKEGFRLNRVTNLPNLVLNYPLGTNVIGTGAASGFISNINGAPQNSETPFAENQFEYTLLDLGLPGLILWLSVHIACLAMIIKVYRKSADHQVKNLSLGLIMFLALLYPICWIFGGLQGMIGASFWLVAGITANLYDNLT